MKNKQLFSTIMCGILSAATLVSCGQTEAVSSADTTTAAPETTTSPYVDSLPEKDYGGDTFTTLIRTEWAYEFDIPEQNGEIINDAVYDRNVAVEERFNVNLEFVQVDGKWDARQTFLNTVTSAILAGDDVFDMVAAYQAYITTPIMEGYFLNILDMPEIDPDAPWWSKKCNDSVTLNNTLYFTTGDIALSMWNGLYVMKFNKKLANENNVPDVYELVRSGKWTLDKLAELSAMVGQDLNGDTVYDENDLYGLAVPSNGNQTRNWQLACNIPITTLNKDGFMEMSLNTERTQDLLEKLVKLYDAETTNRSFFSTDREEEPTLFIENRALFITSLLGVASELRSMDTDFGIIPYPKYDEHQKEYRTTSNNGVSMICFPNTVRDPEMSAIMAEALCSQSYKDVIPQYYDVSLKTKGARDEESGEMIDIIRDSMVFDFGWVHSVIMNSVGQMLADLVHVRSDNFASYYASKEAAILAGLEKINKAYGME